MARMSQDYLFATTGYHLKLVVADKWNASRLLAVYDVDLSTDDVTVVTDSDKPPHGRRDFTASLTVRFCATLYLWVLSLLNVR